MVTSASTPTPGAGVLVSLDYDSNGTCAQALVGMGGGSTRARKAAHLDLGLVA